MTHVVVALPAEARPVISHFRLERTDESSPYRRYSGDELELVVSGIGKAASAAAAAYLFAVTGGERDEPWINLGIGGSGERAIGEPVLAHKVEDVAGGRSWYPPLVFGPPCATALVRTVDSPRLDPAGDAVYEMEAAGFCQTAARFSTAELVQVVKVVSDRGSDDLESLSAARVAELVERGLPALEALHQASRQISRELRERAAPPRTLETLAGRWRFSVTERRRLERLLRRLEVVEPAFDPESLESLRSGAAVLKELEERLESAPLTVRTRP